MDGTSVTGLESILRQHARDTRDFGIGDTVQSREFGIDSISFLREFVSTSRPLLVKEERTVQQAWHARERWLDDEYLLSKAGDVEVTTALTPDGLADCPHDEFFALPCSRKVPLRVFFELLLNQTGDGLVAYLQQQNSSLTYELPVLLDDVERRIEWAEEAFGNEPEAINLWIGRKPSKTSWHRDHFENIYVVVRGCKIVRLLPPTESYRMKLKRYPVATFEEAGAGGLVLNRNADNEVVLWSSIMPCTCLDDSSHSREGFYCSSCKELRQDGMQPLEVKVCAGDVLYIPACWWHEIHHGPTDEMTIVVNYWYDMKHDVKFSSMLLVDRLAEELGLNESPCHSD
eukprot:jgi/Picsp_1/6308/NSC_03657-R1_jmjc domain-containing protein 7-like